MSQPLSPEILERIRQRNLPPPRPPVPWLKILGFLVLLAITAWGAYYFYWQFRLPQQRVITDQQGKTIRARLEARNEVLLKYTLLDDNTIRYIPMENLSPADNIFVKHLAGDMTLDFPLDYQLSDPTGKTTPVRIEAHDADWVKYTLPSDSSSHFVPLASLSPTDQTVMRLLTANLRFQYPVDYTLTGDPKKGAPVRFVGRNEDIVKYNNPADNSIHYALISTLSPTDQSLVRKLPSYLSVTYPVDFSLTGGDGQNIPGQILGRTADVVSTGTPAEGARYYLINDLAATDQKLVRFLPINLSLNFPLTCTMDDSTGKPMSLRLEGRSDKLVKVLRLPNETADYLPLTAFSPTDQKFIQSLPPGLTLNYPFDYTLTDQTGHALQVKIQGRSSNTVKFLSADGRTQTYALAKLSAANQAFLLLLPVNLTDADLTVDSSAPIRAPVESARAKAMRDQITELERENASLEAQLADPVTGPTAKNIAQQKLKENKQRIDSDQKIIDAEDKAP